MARDISAPLAYLFVRVTYLLVLYAICFSLKYAAVSFSVSASSRDARTLLSQVKSSQVAYFQIGTNKCAMQRAQHSKKKKNAASGALIEAEVAWNSSGIRHRLG